jgi:integrase
MQELTPLKRLDRVNRPYFENYVRYLHMRGVSVRTLSTKVWRIYVFFDALGFPDAMSLGKEQIEDFIIARKKKVSPVTLDGEILEARLFLRWLTPDKEKELFPFKSQHHKNILPVERMITNEQIRQLVEACTSQRDRALLMYAWDSAARISEILNTKVGDVQFDQYGAVVIVDGKTGRRRVRLISSVPDMQAWVNQHPLKANPEAPLFVTYRRYGSECRPLNIRTVQNTLKTIGKRAGVSNVHPHIIRHARLTDLVKQGFTEMELRMIAGWEKNSAMPEVYIHLSGRDIEKKILEKAGIGQNEERPRDPMAAQICPRCKKSNTPDAMFCDRCSMTLNEEGVAAVSVVRNLMSDPDDLIAYAEWLKARKSEKK